MTDVISNLFGALLVVAIVAAAVLGVSLIVLCLKLLALALKLLGGI